MDIGDIYAFFQTPKPVFLRQELTVCYVLYRLLEKDSYGSELIRRLEEDYPCYKLSDTLLYEALKFLDTEKLITNYIKQGKRGRPRRMFKIKPEQQEFAQELAQLWENYFEQQPSQQ